MDKKAFSPFRPLRHVPPEVVQGTITLSFGAAVEDGALAWKVEPGFYMFEWSTEGWRWTLHDVEVVDKDGASYAYFSRTTHVEIKRL